MVSNPFLMTLDGDRYRVDQFHFRRAGFFCGQIGTKARGSCTVVRRPIVVMAFRATEICLVEEDCTALGVAVLPCRLRKRGRAFSFQSFLQVLAGGNGNLADDRNRQKDFKSSMWLDHSKRPCTNQSVVRDGLRPFYYPHRRSWLHQSPTAPSG